MAAGRLKVADLVTHCYEIDEATAAYELIEKRADPYLAVQLTYPKPDADVPALPKRIPSSAVAAPGTPSSPSPAPGIPSSPARAPAFHFAEPGPRYSILGQLSGAHDRPGSPGAPPAADQRALRGAADGQPDACRARLLSSPRLRARLPPESAGSVPGRSRPERCCPRSAARASAASWP